MRDGRQEASQRDEARAEKITQGQAKGKEGEKRREVVLSAVRASSLIEVACSPARSQSRLVQGIAVVWIGTPDVGIPLPTCSVIIALVRLSFDSTPFLETG
jgi:hypothetical protein